VGFGDNDWFDITFFFCYKIEELIQETALKWINEFIQLAKEVIVPFTPQLIRAVLPSLAHSAPNIRSSAENVNSNLYKLIFEMPTAAYNTPIPHHALGKESHSSGKFASAVSLASSFMRSTSPSSEPHPMLSPILEKSPQALVPVDLNKSHSDPFDYQATVDALVHQFLDEHEETRVASLDWLLMLHKKAPHKVDIKKNVFVRLSFLCKLSTYEHKFSVVDFGD